MNRRLFSGLLVTVGATVVAGIVGIPALLASFSPAFQRRRPEEWRPIGHLEDFPIGEVRQWQISRDGNAWPRSFREQAVFVWRSSATDCVVFSRTCTDLGCPLQYDSGSTCFFCPCHGGVFAQNGERLGGPPDRPMYRYAHRIRAGLVEIDLASIPAGA